MNSDMWILLLLPVIFGIYFYMNYKKKKDLKKKQQQGEAAATAETSFARKAREMKEEAASKRIRNVEKHLIDYAEYHLSVKEIILYGGAAVIAFFLLGMLFYENVLIAGIIAALGIFFPKMRKKTLQEQRKDKLSVQFKEAIASLSSSLAAGRSIENSFREVVFDLKLLYPDPNTYIIREFEIINRRVENGETIERAIQDFATRSDLEDIMNFSDVFITCKRTGGNLVEVIRRTADIIGEKVEIQQEVQIMIAQKKFESRILSVMPIGMIALLKYSSGDYLEPLYDWSRMGPVIMTICLALLVLSYWLSQRIMNIKV